MTKFSILLKHEAKNFQKNQQLHKNLLLAFLISGICLPMVADPLDIKAFAPLFILIYLPTAMLGICSNVLKQDMEDGSLDFALINHGALSLALAKFIIICLFALGSLIVCIPVFALFFDIQLIDCLQLLFCSSVLSIQTASICVFIASLQVYFGKSSSILSSMLLPFLIPMIILCGIMLRAPQISLAYLAIGILIVTTIITILLSSNLIKDI
jgi:hypothetical protein